MFYKFFSTGVFPDNMKTAKVAPRFKSGHKHDFTNHRSWLRDTDSQNGDALLCIYYINFMSSE